MDMKEKKTGKGNNFPTNCREVQQMKDMEINEKIRYFRKQRGLSQELLAERTGINVNTIRKYEIGMETLHELMTVLDTCTEAQRRRFLLYALDGLSLAEIGVLCGCSKVAVYQSVEAVRKKFINFFENRLNE